MAMTMNPIAHGRRSPIADLVSMNSAVWPPTAVSSSVGRSRTWATRDSPSDDTISIDGTTVNRTMPAAA